MADERYWQWDACRWGTHRVNCYPGSCPFRVYTRDGRVIREEIACSFPEFEDPEFRVPDFNPRGCQKGYQHSHSMYGPDRLLHPMKRIGERGSGQWEKISWAQAFEEIGAKLADIIQQNGPQAIIGDGGTNGAGALRGGGEGSMPGFVGRLGGVGLERQLPDRRLRSRSILDLRPVPALPGSREFVCCGHPAGHWGQPGLRHDL